MESIKILLLSVASAIIYGIAQDLITTRVCVEYFTIGHPPLFPTDDPTMLALGWGVAATWWVGVLLGLPLILVARVGSLPKLSAGDLAKPTLVLMGFIGLGALLGGLAGYAAAKMGIDRLWGPLAARVPAEKHVAFLADAYAHFMAYAVGFIGGIVVWVWALWHRARLRKLEHDRVA